MRRAYLGAMRKLIAANATAGITVSQLAGDSLFPSWRNDPRWQLVPYGIDIERFRNPGDSATMRAALGIPPAARVVGHVGRFVDVKNHQRILEIARNFFRLIPTFTPFSWSTSLRPKMRPKLRAVD